MVNYSLRVTFHTEKCVVSSLEMAQGRSATGKGLSYLKYPTTTLFRTQCTLGTTNSPETGAVATNQPPVATFQKPGFGPLLSDQITTSHFRTAAQHVCMYDCRRVLEHIWVHYKYALRFDLVLFLLSPCLSVSLSDERQSLLPIARHCLFRHACRSR